VIVSEPVGEPRGAALLLQGLGAARSGPGQVWARTARDLADEGVVAVRVDYPGHGDSSGADADRAAQVPFLLDVVTWFRGQTGTVPLGAVGSCHGARLALALSAEGVLSGGLLLVNPWIGASPRRSGVRNLSRRFRRRFGLPAPLDRSAVANLRAASGAMPIRVLVGEHDTQVRATLRGASRRLEAPLTVDVEPGLRLHTFPTPAAQDAVATWVRKWADRLVAEEAGRP
jgi:dienelactone hydrolase